ncbi:DUF3618 domain-containing protein [Lentzea flaviverrucosa]|uniref:DUF3618 domain-containing protein n=1 Tax=Lentzea flaviverrucosa TaxID=200379 RepID=A0A1H9C646_9PSEU|nr:DUF3618 domain-containing protein [Lentzea flaviverrucosa]RDI24458.1 uncharacterized protein DUF3618 [Lentzea flaviverrucosa]SEP96574.1 Protein of unknown function [Lentzea flaviverrucosa]
MGPTPDQIRRDIDNTRAELVDDANRLVDRTSPRRIAQRRTQRIRNRFASMRDSVMGTASGTTSTMQSQAHQAKEVVSDNAGRAAEAVQDAPRQAMRQTQGNPIAAGLIAFGGGLLVASLLPRSQAEQQLVEEISDRASDVIEPAKQALAESAGHLKEEMTSEVRDAAGEVKQTASDAARTTAEQGRSSAQDVTEHGRDAVREVRS